MRVTNAIFVNKIIYDYLKSRGEPMSQYRAIEAMPMIDGTYTFKQKSESDDTPNEARFTP